MSGHTPGPWYVNSAVEREPGKRSRAVHNVFNQDGVLAHIAECGNADNARLVAASPDLLDFACALSHGLRMGYAADELLRDGGSLRARLDAAIRKATEG